MELSQATLILLRDDAYAALLREALTEQLQRIEAEKADVATTRPPFGGMLARKETRRKFEHSMRSVLDSESTMRERLARLEAIDEKLQPVLRHAIGDYLGGISPEYCRLLQILARLDDWERAFQALPEVLLGFARDVRSLRLAAAKADTLRDYRHEITVLREMATRLERHSRELDVIGRVVAEATAGDSIAEIILPDLPDFAPVKWVGQLASQPPRPVAAEAARVEVGVRSFLAEGAEAALARLEASRAACRRQAGHFLQGYWEQLRAHARAHYVEPRDPDAVLAQLYHDYVEADLAQRQSRLFDPLIAR